jgi:hypothetical protein
MASIKKTIPNAGEDVGKGTLHTLLMGMQTSATIMEISIGIHQKTKS